MAARTHRLITSRTSFGFSLAIITLAILLLRYGGLSEDDDENPFPHNALRVAVDASYTPFAVDTGDGLEGIDIDLGKAIGEYLDLPVHFNSMSIDGLYDALVTDQADIVISAMVVDTWRLHQVRYTQAYFDAGLVLVSNKLERMDDLPGHSIAYEFGSSADSEVRRWSRRIDQFAGQTYELPEHALDAVRLEVADSALVEIVDARLYLQGHPNWDPEITYVTHVEFVLAVRIDRKQTFSAIQQALSILQANGTIAQIIENWL